MQHLSNRHSRIGALRQSHHHSYRSQIASRVLQLLSKCVEGILEIFLGRAVLDELVIDYFGLNQHPAPGGLGVLQFVQMAEILLGELQTAEFLAESLLQPAALLQDRHWAEQRQDEVIDAVFADIVVGDEFSFQSLLDRLF